MAYDAASLAQEATFNTTPGGSEGGIWQSGGGPAFDGSGNVYYAAGNGTFDGTGNFGETLLKLSAGSLTLLDFFTPSNFSSLNSGDLDFGSMGPSLIPGTNVLFLGGKEGKGYVVSAGSLGHEASGDTQILQSFQADDPSAVPNATHHLHSSAVYWSSPEGMNAYTWGENDFLRAWRFNASSQQFGVPAFAVGSILPPQGMPGGFLALSANGSQAGSGVLWTTTPASGDANHAVVPGIVRAFHAETLALLWDSSAAADNPGSLAKYNPPLVANGRVYVPSFSGTISVYGLRTSPPPPPVVNGEVTGLQKRASDVCVNVQGSTLTSGTRLQIQVCNGTGGQTWQFNDKGQGLWEIRRSAQNLCMGIPGGNGTTGAAVDELTCDGSAAQTFNVDAVASGFQLRFASTNLCVDDPGNSTTPRTSLQLFACNGTDAQAWIALVPQLRKLDSGTPGLCVDAPGSSLTSGQQLQIFGCNATGAQNWEIDDNFNGTRTVRRNSTGLCMAAAGTPASGSAVTQATCSVGTPAQTWDWEPAGSGNRLRLNGTSLCVDDPGNSSTPGTKLQLFACNGTGAQIFGL